MGADRAQAMRVDPVVSTPPLPVSAGSRGEASTRAASGEEPSLKPVEIARIALVGVAALVSWRGFWAPLDGLVPIVAVAVGGYPIVREALSALFARRMTMELSMTIAIVAAFIVGESFTGLVILLFVLVAEVLEHLTVHRGRRAIGDLLRMLPPVATILRDGVGQEIPIAELRPGALVLIKPGGRLPVDGMVRTGHSFVDQSAVTGEALPVEKLPGARVYAGTVNQAGTLQVEASFVGGDTAFGKIIEAVEQAEKSRAPIQKIADRLAGYVVGFALAAAGLTLLATGDARSTIAVVIVAGACGVAAGTPLAILGAIGQAARIGAIVKGGLHLEALGRVDTVVLDKTGTLTLGKPEIVEILTCRGVPEESLLEAAAIAERPSEHPVAGCILQRASSMHLSAHQPDTFQYIPGGGIVCSFAGEEITVGSRAFLAARGYDASLCSPPAEHLSEVLVARGKRLLGAIRFADVLRPDASEALRSLRGLGLRTILLTGDSMAMAKAVGEELGVDEIRAELLPDEKLSTVGEFSAAGNNIAVVGDGINDAPALAAANVGIAMGSGTDVARESAGVVLLSDSLLVLAKSLQIARRCHRIIMQNFYGTLLIDSLGIAFAAVGMLTPLWAAFIHVSSELAFILNSARLLPRGRG